MYYTKLQFLNRFKALQNLISSDDPNFPQAILLIPGLDGRNNKEATKTVKYLLEGAHGEDLYKGGFDEDSLDDVVILIQESKLSIFYGAQAKKRFGPLLLSAYPSCYEYTTTPLEEEDVDAFQMKKCESFKKMVLSNLPVGCKVGIPVPIGYDDVLDVESWPLLQSFALESVI